MIAGLEDVEAPSGVRLQMVHEAVMTMLGQFAAKMVAASVNCQTLGTVCLCCRPPVRGAEGRLA